MSDKIFIGDDEVVPHSLKGEFAEVITPASHPPGKPLVLRLGELTIHAKSRGSVLREDEARYLLSLRLVNVKRADREALEHAFPPVE